ncbi:glutamine--fructose-6-phosphate transaminase (isomerizing) [bacterium (Candidatus Gribaldobacteria) CG08_land_8_20_14_0_20_39_15]|uniref:Glutamine--fructose-6-phosphate aminotransferase [isomerizing] n=1 Tax=bacterium (Candidatus Gribaldobacteria) CG08_land_8_20_14_0_20_39_15 TaxID=2014273 RepID=A0A2M6XTY1_9BACT|nr:MAG: glutamine--fructose-6-phosphate transaminase (isomerizing) [bacterium (Candidatus Gribaldobacteria) CG08_land_8_20_14_0_20_39_15]
MCGIFGYIGSQKAAPLLIEGLKQLEYRGYDSAGLCLLEPDKLNTFKSKGKVEELAQKVSNENLFSSIGIAHTRWATHGEPSEINAHPHLDCQGRIAVVHNGIIENYQALKTILQKEGHKFISDTDTEVIAHLIEKFSDGNNFETAVLKALCLIEGAYGLAVLRQGENKIIGAKKGSPLILGIGNNEFFLTSDSSAILSHTNKVIFLQNNEIVVMNEQGYQIKNLQGDLLNKEIEELKWNVAQIEKSGFKHFMLKEIFEQPQAIANTLRGRLKDEDIKLTFDIEPSQIKRLIILACGTSFYSGLIGKYIIEKMCRINTEVDYASEFRYRDPIIGENDLVVAISQSGETADTLAALREAKRRGAKTLGIINTVGSTIAREVDTGIYLHAGPEIGVASTKAFTCQITALVLLALYLQKKTGKFDKVIAEELKTIPQKVQEILDKSCDIEKVAQNIKDKTNVLYLGRGFNFPVALEGALKLKEISYIHAEGYPAAEMKHGPIALIDENMPVVFIATQDETHEKVLNNIQEVKARKGKILAIVNPGDTRAAQLADWLITVPLTIDLFSPIINIIPLQLLAYYTADLKGIDVDKPRNLAKSVTVE